MSYLPKRHTPQVGLSLGTGSYSLAWHRSAISVNWCTDARELWEDEATLSPKGKNTSNSTHLDNQLTILLLPWPLKILSRDFSSQQYGDRRFFRFKPREQDKAADFLVRRKLDRIIKEAKDETEHIDMVILPESAVCDSTRSEMEKILRRWNVSTYITGVRVGELPDGTPTDEENPGTLGNQLCLGYTSKENHKPRTNNGFQHVWYKKHHRWKLDSSQIKTYELGGQLAPDKDHWEDIEIREREAVFVNLRSRLTLCPIICEDLARQESLSELIRAVGPSLVISLLMDGPQRRNRWSSQYASFFGDDPGSSVLTLTSMGMVD
ncbi:MAG: hypothetical protein VST68_09470 [Nitrospirota bacterium]|nr:hypothetical protein [Nitrospirota bacterium]